MTTDNIPEEAPEKEFNTSPGLRRRLGKGCLIAFIVLLAIIAVVGFILWRKIQNEGGWDAFINKKSAEYLQYVVKSNVELLPLNKAEQESITKPIAGLAEKMKTGHINAKQSRDFVTVLYHTALPEVFILLAFQSKYIDPKDNAAALTFNRAANGLISGKITIESIKPFNEVILVNPKAVDLFHKHVEGSQDPARKIKFKELSEENRKLAVNTLKEIADKSSIPYELRNLNFTPTLTKLIDSVAVTPKSTKTKKAEVENKK